MALTRTIITQSGMGTALTQAILAAHYKAMACNASYVVSGLELHYDAAGLDIDINAGTAWVAGYYVNQSTDTLAQAVTASQTNYIWLEKDGDFEIEITGTPTDTDALLLGTCVADGSGVTSVTHVKDITNGRNVYIRKASDQLYSSGTPDTDFTFTANPREVWSVNIIAIVSQSDATENFQMGFAVPSGSITYGAMGPDDDTYTASTVLSGDTQPMAYTHGSGTTETNTITIEHAAMTAGVVCVSGLAVIGDTGGALNWRWNRNSVGAGGTTVKAGSVFLARRILG